METLFLCLKNKSYLPPPGSEIKVPAVPEPPSENVTVGADVSSKNNSESDGGSKRRADEPKTKVRLHYLFIDTCTRNSNSVKCLIPAKSRILNV